MGGGGSQVTGSHAPSSQLPSSVHWRLNARLKGSSSVYTYVVFFHSHTLGWGTCSLLLLPLGFVGDMIAWPALIFAQRSHLETGLVAALRLQHCVRHRGRGWTAELAEGFWEGPETVFHAGQGVVCTCGNTDRERG